MYTNCGLYDGDMDSEEISCYKEKLVKCTKPHKCSCCKKKISIGDYVLSETGFMDRHAISCYFKGRNMVQFEIYDRETNKTVDVKTGKHFKDYGVLIDLDGHMLLTQYGNIVCGADERYYGIRIANQN